MDKRPLIGFSICAVVLLVLASLSNVVGYQTVESSHQLVINNAVNQRELVFQTILDIANNKEIQGIILRYQLSQGKVPDVTNSVLTMKQLKQMYVIGLVLSKIVSKSAIQSMIEKYQINNPMMQNEINAVIEKDTKLKMEITQLSSSECGCENENTIEWTFPIICAILFPIFMYALILWFIDPTTNLVIYIGDIAKTLHCFWEELAP